MMLVEYWDQETMRRCWLPWGHALALDELRGGVPYGVDAEHLRSFLQATAELIAPRLEHALHARGLYTVAEVESLPEPGQLVAAALTEAQQALVPLVVDLLRQEV
jgi:hypothetical protein